jgi:hypothetical protein
VPLKLPPEDLRRYEAVGIYTTSAGTPDDFQLAFAVPTQVDMFQKPHWPDQRLHSVKHLPEVRQILQWRNKPQARRFQPPPKLRADLSYLAIQRYHDLHEQLPTEQQSWSMSPLRITFVQEGLRRGVGREALILACLLETEAVTFILEIVAEAWVTLRVFGCRPSRAVDN